MNPPPPPRPPPHNSAPHSEDKRGGLPNGNYDIFIIPPHSAGSGFLYLPSLQPHRNSFLAGVGCTLTAVAIWNVFLPMLRQWLEGIVGGSGIGIVVLMLGMGAAGWAWGKQQMDSGGPFGGQSGPSGYAKDHAGSSPNPPPHPESPPGYGSANSSAHANSSWSRAGPAGANTPHGTESAKSAWEKAREETKRKDEERKKAEEVKQRIEELRRKREEAEEERKKQREKEAKDREMRERREREAKEREERAKARQPTARTEADEDAYSYRPYDAPKAKTASSVYSGSYAPSQSTARSTPPPSHRGPYVTKDPDKIVLKAVYSFTNAHQRIPLSQLVSGVGAVTDGLILRITTEGLFIDDDVRGVPQREWDVKAWTMKLVETAEYKRMHVLRASIRDQEGKRYVFVLPEDESWKVNLGVQRLKKGSQARALATSGLPLNECRAILENMGWA